jgi:peroxiredoxin
MRKIIIGLLLLIGLIEIKAQDKPEGLFIGSKAPDFKAKDQDGKDVRLKDLLKKGKVVLVFYRGYWCPYCNRELSRLQDSLSLIQEKGATVVAVSPEKPELIKQTVEKTKAAYPVIYDEGLKIMKGYEVEYELEETTLARYRSSGLDIEKNNGTNGKYLPVPAVYIIDKESNVTYRFFDTDYKKRPSIAEILKNL